MITSNFSLESPVATPMRFCSAIPRSIYCSGRVFLNLSNPADVDTSQVKTIKFLFFYAISNAAIPNVAL